MKLTMRILSLFICAILLVGCGAAPANQTTQPTTVATEPKPEGIRNIIIIIGDGTGDEQLEAGELASGTTFVFRDWQHTHANTDSLHSDGSPGKLTDSAAGGTALATGQLTTNGKVGQGPNSNEALKTILDYAKEQDKATAVVTTDTMYGATPGAFSGHAADRGETLTILYSQLESDIDLMCSDFDDETAAIKGNITGAGYDYCDFISKIDKTKDSEKVYWQFDMAGANATAKLEKVVPHALEFLEKDADGFVMMIEQAHIDKYCHSNEIEGTQICANSLNNTVAAVLEWCEGKDDTAIIITADHETGGLSVSPDDIYANKYISPSGNTLYYEWASTGHTQTPVSVYFYGFEADLSSRYIDDAKTLIKNTSVFDIMLELLQNPIR